MGYYSDKTAARAIGAVDREWTRMVILAYSMRIENCDITDEKLQMFTGIFSRLLTDPLTELEKVVVISCQHIDKINHSAYNFHALHP